jgi:acetyl CoA:N6-hydroxylysine acetyl transferase
MHPPLILTDERLPRLFCKPEPGNFIYYSQFAHLPNLICFKSLDLEKDLPVIHRWVNMDYAKTFWQMEGSFEPLLEVYEKIMGHANAHSFVGFYGDQLICQLDLYMIGVDELSYHLPGEEEHCGFHLLMAPRTKTIPGLTSALVRGFLEYYFSFPAAQKMYGEPDTRNQKSIALVKQAGFEFQRTISLSYKTAFLYSLSRS